MTNLLGSVSRLSLYVLVSYVITLLYVVDCVNTYRALYPVAVYLSNSSVFLVMFGNFCVANIVGLWQLSHWTFFGHLSPLEATAVATSASFYVSDAIVGLLYSGYSLMGKMAAAFAVTLVWQLLHRVERERVAILGSLPDRERGRKVMGLVWFGWVSVAANLAAIFAIIGASKGAMGNELLVWYTLALTCTQTLFTTLCSLSLLAVGSWRLGTVSPRAFYVKTFWDYASSICFIAAFTYACIMITPPFMLVRNFFRHGFVMYETTVQFLRYLRLGQLTRRLDSATEADLETERRCSICYDDMLPDGTTKRLPCGHCYHTACLQQWFQSNGTCPYCRADLLHPRQADLNRAAQAAAAAAAAAAGQQRAPAGDVAGAAAQGVAAAPAGALAAEGGLAARGAELNEAIERALHNDVTSPEEIIGIYQDYCRRVAARHATVAAMGAPEAARAEERPVAPSAASASPPPPPPATVPSPWAPAAMASPPTPPPVVSQPVSRQASTATAKAAARVRAYEEYHASVKQAEERLLSTLAAIDSSPEAEPH